MVAEGGSKIAANRRKKLVLGLQCLRTAMRLTVDFLSPAFDPTAPLNSYRHSISAQPPARTLSARVVAPRAPGQRCLAVSALLTMFHLRQRDATAASRNLDGDDPNMPTLRAADVSSSTTTCCLSTQRPRRPSSSPSALCSPDGQQRHCSCKGDRSAPDNNAVGESSPPDARSRARS